MPHGTLSDGLWSMRLAIERATGTHGAQGLLGRVRVVCERAGVRLGDGDRPRVGSRVLLQSAPGAAMRTHSRYVRRFHLTARSRGWSLARLSASRVSLPPRMAMTPPRSPAGRPAAILRTATLDDMRENRAPRCLGARADRYFAYAALWDVAGYVQLGEDRGIPVPERDAVAGRA